MSEPRTTYDVAGNPLGNLTAEWDATYPVRYTYDTQVWYNKSAFRLKESFQRVSECLPLNQYA